MIEDCDEIHDDEVARILKRTRIVGKVATRLTSMNFGTYSASNEDLFSSRVASGNLSSAYARGSTFRNLEENQLKRINYSLLIGEGLWVTSLFINNNN